MKKAALIIFSLFFFSSVVFAATAEGKTEKKGEIPAQKAGEEYLSTEIDTIENPVVPQAPGLLETIFKLIISLLFVIGLIYILMIALKFFYVRASIPMRTEGVVKVLAKEYLEDKKSLYVIEFGRRVLLLGATPESISQLAEVTDIAEKDEIKAKSDEYISKYRMKNETKFSEELKGAYLKQGKQIVESGNKKIKNLIDMLRKSGGKKQ